GPRRESDRVLAGAARTRIAQRSRRFPLNQLRVAVLGAAGTIAPAILADLAVSEEVLSVLALDLDGEKVAAVAAAHGGAKTRARAAAARSGPAGALAGVDLLITAASSGATPAAMRACLAAGCPYFDLG